MQITLCHDKFSSLLPLKNCRRDWGTVLKRSHLYLHDSVYIICVGTLSKKILQQTGHLIKKIYINRVKTQKCRGVGLVFLPLVSSPLFFLENNCCHPFLKKRKKHENFCSVWTWSFSLLVCSLHGALHPNDIVIPHDGVSLGEICDEQRCEHEQVRYRLINGLCIDHPRHGRCH